jgi:heme/copper-type cytochrome/quinol oxidase subunit 2
MNINLLVANVFFVSFIVALITTIVLAVTKKSNPYENKFNFNNNLKTLLIIFVAILLFHYSFNFFTGKKIKLGGSSVTNNLVGDVARNSVLTNAPDF